MLFWILAAVMTLIAAGALVAPLVRKARATTGDVHDGALLAARLAAIDRDESAGLIAADAAAEAALEEKRAALARVEAPPGGVAKRSRLAAFAFAGASPLAAFWIYMSIGAPELIGVETRGLAPSDPAAIALMPAEERQAMIEGMVAGLAARLQADPEDPEGWRMLARSYATLGDEEKSALAWRNLLDRVEGDIEDWRGYAGALLALGPGGGREAELMAAIDRLLALDPDDPMALYYLGTEAMAAGEGAAAADYWRRLLAVLPADAPVRPAIEELIAKAEKQAPLPPPP